MPGVQATGVVNDLPLRGSNGLLVSVSPEGAPDRSPDDMQFARYLQASAGYFQALGIPLIAGRLMAETDTKDAPHVIVVSAGLAKKFWPGQDPIGKRLAEPSGRRPDGSQAPPVFRTVVGVVADVRELKLDEEPPMQMYFPASEQVPQNVAIVVRGDMPPNALLDALRSAAREAAPSQAVYNVRTMDDVMATSLTPRRLNTLLISAFGALALFLSVVGVYGVVAYSVTRRTRELGIRAALGATAGNLVRLVAGESAVVALCGIVLGLGGAYAFSRALASMLYEVRPQDTATFVAAPVILFLLVLAATLVPARRAAKLNPVDVMRSD
jgi:putative ABC transport system permease protein